MMKIITVDELSRIDSYVSNKLNLSRTFVQKLIDNGSILLDEKLVKNNHKLKLNQLIYVNIEEEPKEPNILAVNIPLNIFYEDEDVIVINKQQGMVVHPAVGHYDDTLVNALMYHCKGNLSGINGITRPGIVHRIDKDTSGLIIVAKNDSSHKHLAEQFANHTIEREYVALVFGNIKEDNLTINKPIDRHKVDRKKRAVSESGKHAITHIRVLERFNKYTLVKANLETGRTHQIRVHMSSINKPLVGDTVYGKENQPFKTSGQLLHAKKLGFIHPSTFEKISLDSELPTHFIEILKKIENKKDFKIEI